MSMDMWHLLIEGAGFGFMAAAVVFGLFSDWLIVKRLSSVFVTRELFEQYKLLAARDTQATTEALTQLSASIKELSNEQKQLGEILARIEGALGGLGTIKKGK